jgi:hypothetical protein
MARAIRACARGEQGLVQKLIAQSAIKGLNELCVGLPGAM